MADKKHVKNKNSHCLVCKRTGNKKFRGVTLLNKIASHRSLCTVYSSQKSTFLKQKHNSKMFKLKMFR